MWKVRADVYSTLSKWGTVNYWKYKSLFYIIFTKRNGHGCTTVRQVKYIQVYSASYSY